MAERFYLPVDLGLPCFTLEGQEAHHLARVMRKQPGDRVVLFDGSGRCVTAEIHEISKRAVELTACGPVETTPPATRELTLFTAVPKGDRFKWLVEKAAELGVGRLVPLQCERSVVDPRNSKLDKMRQVVIEACKQSGRNRLMEIGEPVPFGDALQHDGLVMMADPTGEPLSGIAIPEGNTSVLIGPEGGFSPDELSAAAEAGVRPVRIADAILRIETAGVAIAGWLSVQRLDVS